MDFFNYKLLNFLFMFLFIYIKQHSSVRVYSKEQINKLRDETKAMFYHGYNSYLKYAYPYDELRPISCDGFDTYGSYSLTLIDALDTLAIMGNKSEFQRVVDILLTSKTDFDVDINVSVFETNIRIVGGLLSAHLLSHKAGMKLEPGWPCNGPLLRLAEDVAKRLVVAFDTKTGMPYGTVNLRKGVPKGETTVTCTAGIGTFIVEFGTLSRLTGDPLYEEVAMNALYSLFEHKSPLGLFGNHIDIETGQWTAQDAGIGSGVDSYYEYLVKGSILLQRPELMEMFKEAKKSIDKYLKKDDWYMWATMNRGLISLPVFQSLDSFWPGLLSLTGDTTNAMRTLHNYHQVWQQYGFIPEIYYIGQTEAGSGKEVYPLRPELIESIMLLYRATGDPFLLQAGEDILRSIQHSARTPCGYATIKDVRSHRKEDRMESFFLAETTKYLYLLFDTDNFMHNQGQHGTVINTPHGECVIDAGGYIYNTEAHPVDPSALHCCHSIPTEDLYDFSSFRKNKATFIGIPIKKLQEEIILEEVETAPLELKNDSLELSNTTLNVTNQTARQVAVSGYVSTVASLYDANNNDTSTSSEKKKEGTNTVKNITNNTPKKPFDPQEMLERLRMENMIRLRNETWESNYQTLSCNAQPFLDKLSIMGEFFN